MSNNFSARRNQNLYRQPTKLRLGVNSATFVVIAITCVLAFLYLHQITKTGVLGYKATELDTARNKINAEKQDMSVEAARLQSIQTIKSSQTAGRMVPTDKVSYAK